VFARAEVSLPRLDFDFTEDVVADSKDVLPKEVMFVIAAIAGSVALWFSVRGLLTPPYVAKWSMWSGLALAAVSICFLTFIAISTTRDQLAELSKSKPVGLMNNLGFLSVGLLFFFIIANMWTDALSPPKILRLKVTPVAVTVGGYVDVEAEAQVKSGDALAYSWSLDGGTIPAAKHALAQLKAPQTPGLHQISVTISDGSRAVVESVTVEVVPKPPRCPSDGPSAAAKNDNSEKAGS